MQKIFIALAPNISVEITDDHETKLFRAAAFWAELPRECPVCKQPLIPTFRTPQSFTYYGLRCLGTPSHSVNLGESKEGHNLYFDRQKPWTIWGSADPVTPEAASPAAPVDNSHLQTKSHPNMRDAAANPSPPAAFGTKSKPRPWDRNPNPS